MRIDIIPNFATHEEITALNEWAELGVKNKWIDQGIHLCAFYTPLRLTSRLYSDRYEYPQIVRDLSERIRKFVGIDSYPLITGQGRDGVVVSYTYPGGDVYPHKDRAGLDGLATLRCNIMTQKADDGCQLYVDGVPVNINVGDLHCYLVSEYKHWATQVVGKTPRIMWMFGAHVPVEAWEKGFIKGDY